MTERQPSYDDRPPAQTGIPLVCPPDRFMASDERSNLMNEQPIADFQRIRLAYDQGKNGEKLPATHGNFSEGFYKRLTAALKLAPGVVEHVMRMITVAGGTDDRVDGSRDAPLPMNTQAFNDVNEIYSRLVYWSTIWGQKLNRQPPGPAKRAWAATSTGKIMGLPANIEPETARYLVGIMSTWLHINLVDILGTSVFDDVQFFHDELTQDIFRINAAWPQQARPEYSHMPCTIDTCTGKIAIYPPNAFRDDQLIKCERCGNILTESRYEFYWNLYKQIAAETDPVKKHLMRKYGAA
jgi:hypothetical protein